MSTPPPGAPSRRFSDFFLFFLLPFPALSLAGLPLYELAMAGAASLALTRPADPARRMPAWVVGLLAALLLWACTVALLMGLAPYRRLLHMTVFAALIVLIGQGRFAMPSVARGLALGMVVSGGAGLIGFGNAGYAGRLTGYLADPNAAGYYLVALTAVAAAYLSSPRQRLLLATTVSVLIALTLSRTSMLAVALGGSWVLAGRRLRPVANLALSAVLVYAVTTVADRLRNWGPFESRTGSDLLRTQIVEAERIKVDTAGWIGNGPGTSTVLIGDDTFFFHNSYLGLWNELGLIGVAIMAALLIGLLLSAARLPQHDRNLWLEGGVVAVATCAMNLGEVLLELPTAVLLGAVLHHVLGRRSAAADQATALPISDAGTRQR